MSSVATTPLPLQELKYTQQIVSFLIRCIKPSHGQHQLKKTHNMTGVQVIFRVLRVLGQMAISPSTH